MSEQTSSTKNKRLMEEAMPHVVKPTQHTSTLTDPTAPPDNPGVRKPASPQCEVDGTFYDEIETLRQYAFDKTRSPARSWADTWRDFMRTHWQR